MASKTCKIKITNPINGEETALLSWTSAMDAWSWSLPAGPKNGSCVYAYTDTPDSVCNFCYAELNRYNMTNVMKSQFNRWGWVQHCLSCGPAGEQHVIDVLTYAIRTHCRNGYMRWYDSGDFFSEAAVRVSLEVCRNTPSIKHWFPTRIWRSTSQKFLKPLKELAALPNVAVKPSALLFNADPPVVDGLGTGTNVLLSVNDAKNGVELCPKSVFSGSCESNSCRECWNKNGKKVGFLIHGIRGMHRPCNVMSEKNQSKRTVLQALTISGLKALKKAADSVNQH